MMTYPTYLLRFSKSAIWLLLALTVLSCKKDKPEPEPADRTVMVYMAANNSLAHVAYTNINQMEESFRGITGNLIVYARIFGQPPRLYQISHDDSPEIRSKIVKTYFEHDSSDPAVMKMVFDDMQGMFPARSYGAVLWSHATNWFPANALPQTRSFGDDEGSRMDIQQLAAVLPADLEYLIFDACSMASVEVLYELRDVAPYILASPTEVLSVGMPYHLIAADLFHANVEVGLTRVAQQCYAYYQQNEGLNQSASYSLIETAQLPQLARVTGDVLSSTGVDFSRIDRNTLQRMDFDPTSPIVAFDFLDLFKQYFSAEQYAQVRAATESVVLYKVSTERYLNKPISTFSGLSCYVPEPQENHVHDFYLGLGWAADAKFNRLFWW